MTKAILSVTAATIIDRKAVSRPTYRSPVHDRSGFVPIAIVPIALVLMFCVSANADVWEFRSDGQVMFHKAVNYERRLRMNAHVKPATRAVLNQRRAKYAGLIEEIAVEKGVDAPLVHAIIKTESLYDKDAVSEKGAVGLMQLMPKTAARYGVEDATDARQNVAAGAAYLKDLTEQFDGRLSLVLAAYNAGEDKVEYYDRTVPPFPETQAFVGKVLAMVSRGPTSKNARKKLDCLVDYDPLRCGKNGFRQAVAKSEQETSKWKVSGANVCAPCHR